MENKNRKNFIASLDIRQTLNTSTQKLVDAYIGANGFETKEYFCYLVAAIYLTYKEMYPDLSTYIPFRIKSDYSFSANLKKEFSKGAPFFNKKYFDKLKSASSRDEFESAFLPGVTDDIAAATVVLDHINSSERPRKKYVSDNINELFDKCQNNLFFISNVEKEIDEGFMSEEEYFKYRINTLERLIDSTFPEFTFERTIPYQDELEHIKAIFNEKEQTSNFALSITEKQTSDLEDLLDDLNSRAYDKLEYSILEETLPKVLSNPLIKEALHVNSQFNKNVKKDNGFAALYYILKTPFGKIELQAQSNKRYYEAKKGSAFHSGLSGKQFNVDDFFELVDSNDSHKLDYYLSELGNTPVDTLISDYEVPSFSTESEKKEFLKTPKGKRYARTKRVEELASHIRIKPQFTFTDKSGSTQQVPTDQYLFSLACSISPYMGVCSSGHTSFSTATVHSKNLVNEFAEVLRKRDSTTYLGNMLITRLENIIKDGSITNEKYSKREKISNSLPRDISRRDILNYAERLDFYFMHNTPYTEKDENEL